MLGSFTTFAAHSLEVVELAEADRFGILVGYVAVSVLGGLGLAILGGRMAGVRA